MIVWCKSYGVEQMLRKEHLCMHYMCFVLAFGHECQNQLAAGTLSCILLFILAATLRLHAILSSAVIIE